MEKQGKKKQEKNSTPESGAGGTHYKCLSNANSDLYYVFTYKHQMEPGSVNFKFYSDTLPHSPFEELSPE